ncbi:MAG: hypothetical protein A2Y82_04895 [Candidatus Buchananbacteria bacterium RBG_13_36_9]|uniref:Colicin V production protein n=1 Tax=Candidatus Buchananbacteria bacterium RBG_13_36_9 TaxID=1797530 RepID=A0A1G1XRQ8_9BACT|nr:MAG: hypothetical protein A2Y82_04895 [Candidatus Buchananbacteria bacterium RBG_13_36_9]
MFGLWFGLIHTLGAIVGTFAGAFFAGLWYDALGGWLESIFGHSNLMRIFAFIFIFILFNRLIGFAFYVLDKVFKFLTIIPFLKTINRLLGGILGFFEGILIIGLSLFVVSRFPLSDWFIGVLQGSAISPWFIGVSKILQLMLPELLKQIQSVI